MARSARGNATLDARVKQEFGRQKRAILLGDARNARMGIILRKK
jgi:hypothetical protein